MNTIQWGEPRPLRQSADTIPFPLEALPSVLRNMVQAISITTSTDVGMTGTVMLSAVGYCFTGLYRLAGKADHTEPPVLYSIIIAQPSERKSPVMHLIKEPFDTFESKYNNEHLEEMYKAQQDVKALEARVKAMEREDESNTAAIAKLRVQADNIRNTTPIRIAVDDITPESLVIELSENDSLLMISDESGMLSNFNGKYSNDIPNFDLLLKGKKDWGGEETLLHLSRHASEEYISYCNNYIEKEIKESMCCCQDCGGKFHGLILRIAYILHCADCCSRCVEPSEESVNHDTLVKSFSIAHYYRYQAIYGFSVNAPDGNIVKAEKIAQFFKTKNIKQGLKSDLYHSCRCKLFSTAKDFYSTLDTLAEYGYIAYEDVTAANNKKAQIVYVNPHI